jgi:hypothetical protein
VVDERYLGLQAKNIGTLVLAGRITSADAAYDIVVKAVSELHSSADSTVDVGVVRRAVTAWLKREKRRAAKFARLTSPGAKYFS